VTPQSQRGVGFWGSAATPVGRVRRDPCYLLARAACSHRCRRRAIASAEDRGLSERLCEQRELLHSDVRPSTASHPEGRPLPDGLGGQRPFLHRGAAAALTSRPCLYTRPGNDVTWR
jgi:hypothetical protein